MSNIPFIQKCKDIYFWTFLTLMVVMCPNRKCTIDKMCKWKKPCHLCWVGFYVCSSTAISLKNAIKKEHHTFWFCIKTIDRRFLCFYLLSLWRQRRSVLWELTVTPWLSVTIRNQFIDNFPQGWQFPSAQLTPLTLTVRIRYEGVQCSVFAPGNSQSSHLNWKEV